MFGPKHTLCSVARSIYEGLESGSVVLPVPRFESRPRYSPDGDFLTLFLRDVEYYAKPVDRVLTVYCSVQDEEFVGCKIEGVRKLLGTLDEFGLNSEDAEVDLNVLLMAGVIQSPAKHEQYQSFGKRIPPLKIPRRDLQPA